MDGEHLRPAIFGHAQCENPGFVLIHLIHHIGHQLHSGRVNVDERRFTVGIFLRGEMLIAGREIFKNSSR